MNLLPGIEITASALNAERIRMDVIAENIANAQTTRSVDGKPYQRKVVAFEAVLDHQNDNSKILGSESKNIIKKVEVGDIRSDPTPGPLVYNPAHPHANDQGMVQMSNVQVSREMVDLISASRAYEANLNVISTSRQMARQVMSIGK